MNFRQINIGRYFYGINLINSTHTHMIITDATYVLVSASRLEEKTFSTSFRFFLLDVVRIMSEIAKKNIQTKKKVFIGNLSGTGKLFKLTFFYI